MATFRILPLPIRILAFGLLLLFSSCRTSNSIKPDPDVERMVKTMLSARVDQRQISPLTRTFGSFSIQRAYRIQSELDRGLEQRLGPSTGYKVAFASKVAQEQFGIDEPARGTLFRLQRLPSGTRLRPGAFMGMMIETEVAFTLDRNINRPIETVEQLKPYVRWVHVAFDLVDQRFQTGIGRLRAADIIASGAGAYFFVLGPAVDPDEMTINDQTLTLTRNGDTVSSRPVTDVMGSPWKSFLWLVNHVVSRGGHLSPGDVVLTGTAGKPYRADAAHNIRGEYEGDCGNLGTVALTIR